MIPKNIEMDHILRALKHIDKYDVPKKRQSRDYFLVFNNKLYPHKYVISMANKFANGVELDPIEFISIESRTFLKKLGFTVVRT